VVFTGAAIQPYVGLLAFGVVAGLAIRGVTISTGSVATEVFEGKHPLTIRAEFLSFGHVSASTNSAARCGRFAFTVLPIADREARFAVDAPPVGTVAITRKPFKFSQNSAVQTDLGRPGNTRW
jgi:hypothetical protein